MEAGAIVPLGSRLLTQAPIGRNRVAWWSYLRIAMSAAAQAQLQTPTRTGVLAILLRLGEATAGDLAGRLGVSVQVTRRHLRSLEDEGLVEASSNAEGPGRPSNLWRLTSAGQGQFPDGSESFALGLLQSLAGQLPDAELRSLLDLQAVQQAATYRKQLGDASLEVRLARLVELRKGEGYVAECIADGDSWVISEFHCSIMRIAEQFPCICDQELHLIRHTFPDCEVERVHWRLEAGHSCGFRLTPRP